MKTRRLGDSDLDLSVIGLGTWAIGGGGWAFAWGEQDDDDSHKTILEALENGVNWIDTAAVYGLGHSELVVGRAIREWRDRVIVATKCGRVPDENGRPVGCLKRDSVMRECEDSLRRLRVDCIDLYQMHWPQPDEDIEEGFQAMLDLQRQGKVRWLGVSNFNVEQLERVSALGSVVSLQPPYSMFRREVEEETLPWCQARRCGVVAYSPLQCGLLTGKVTKDWAANLPDDDWRRRSAFFQEPALSGYLTKVEKLKELAARRGGAVGQLAIAWTLRRPELTAAIVGARAPGQITAWLAAGDWELSAPEIEELEDVLG